MSKMQESILEQAKGGCKEMTDKDKKPKSKSISAAELDLDVRSTLNIDDPNIFIPEDPHLINLAVQRAANEKENQRQAKLEAKRQEEERRAMEEREKQEIERHKLEQKQRTNLPERQLQMFLSGERRTCTHCHRVEYAELYGHSTNCPIRTGIDIEPGLALLRKEFSTGKIIRRIIGDLAYNRLLKFAKDDETWDDCVNRLLDFVTAEAQRKRSPNETLQTKKLGTNNSINDNAVLK